MNGWPAGDWFPIGVFREEGRWLVDWCRLGSHRFVEPFFDETVERCLHHPFNLAFRRLTPLDELAENDPGALAPSGFIFHLSRCGSTLVSQSLAASTENLVVSEAAPIDQIVRARRFEAGVRERDQVRRLRAIVAAFGRMRSGPERNFVLKLDAWHALDLPLFERAFPGVPSIFMYRDPLEIMVSHARHFSLFMASLNAPSLLGISLAEAQLMPRAEYHARMLGKICEAVVAHDITPDALVAYDELPAAIEERILPRFGIELTPQAQLNLRNSLERNAKMPQLQFSSDVEEKQREVTTEMRSAFERYVGKPYAELEAIHKRRMRRSTMPAQRPMVLRAAASDRLILREPEAADAEALCDYYQRNAARFAPWDPPRSADVAEHHAWIAARQAQRHSGHPVAFLAFDPASSLLAGVVTLNGFGDLPPSAMIDYTLDANFEGKGYGTEAVSRIVSYAFDTLALELISAYYHPDNFRSGRLLERAGFRVVARPQIVPGLEHLMRPQIVAIRERPRGE